MFLSVRRCVEPMTQLPRLKVVTIQVYGIYPSISCLFNICWTLWNIFIKHHPNVPLSETVCWAHDLATKTQGHNSRSYDLPLNFVSAAKLLDWVNFTHMFLSVRSAEPMTQLSRPNIKVTVNFKVMGFSGGGCSCPSDCCLVLNLGLSFLPLVHLFNWA